MNEQEQFEDWWDQDCDTTMNPYSNTSMMYWAWEAWKAGRKAEREACARLCDKDTNPNTDKYEPVSQYQSGCYITAEYLAAAIRARGQHD
jgi:hypothetical protein